MSSMPDSSAKTMRTESPLSTETQLTDWFGHVADHIEDTLAMISDELSHDDVKREHRRDDVRQHADTLRLTEFPLEDIDWGVNL